MPPRQLNNDLTITRRRALQLLGVGAVGATFPLACARSEEASGGSGEFHAAYPYSAPPKGHFNYLGGVSDQIILGYLWDLMMIPGGTYLWAEQKYYYLFADDSTKLSTDGKTFTYVVRDGMQWSDGTKITAKDLYTTWLLRWANAHAVFEYVESFEQTDDMTVTFKISTPSPLAEYWLLRERPVPDADFGKWSSQVEPILKAGKENDDPEVVKIIEDVNKFKPKEAIVSGPFHVDYGKVGNQELTMVKNDKGYKADDINFETIKVYNGETIVVTPLVLDQSIDYATHGFAVATEQQFTKIGYDVLRPPTYGGPAIYINFDRCTEFQDKRARQALAYLIDRAQTGRVSLGESGTNIELMAGISDRLVPTWMLEEDQQKLIRYDQSTDKATSLLEDAGWEKREDGWYTPEGKKASYDLGTPSNLADNSAAAQDVQGQLGAFGINIVRRGVESTQLAEDIKAGKLDMGIGGWGSASNPYPAQAYRSPLLDYNIPGLEGDNQRGIGFEMTQQTDVVGEIDLEQAIIDAGLGEDEDALKANASRLALAFNELLPIIPLYDRLGNNPVNRDNIAGWPDFDDPIYENSPYADNFVTILMYEGKLKPA